ncbi:hypothetical protein [Arthrobacter sp. GMC3]|uniref:hypothetical protein n=1 Tax=Arthrobacter sp. GMC3 TaxID=2058894 RepID=UPI000CE2C2CD|nr:hypothetical protein [Arthrobacter sp. GMC3]
MTLTTATGDQEFTATTITHEHSWLVESAHTTSEGRVVYLKCSTGCGSRQVAIRATQRSPMAPLSGELGSGSL